MRRIGPAATTALATLGVLLALGSAMIGQSQSPSQLPKADAKADPDTDGDGLSDFQEKHKYRTDPAKADSDGDGVPDGDWRERREYQYTVRSVVQVMRPVTPDFLSDDYQDVRVLDETRDYVELEVIHYPFNSVAEALIADKRWRESAKRLGDWIRPGPTSDWTPELRQALIALLKERGVDAAVVDDRTLVERASEILLETAKVHDGFTTFLTAFDAKGMPFVPAELRDAAERGRAATGLSPEKQWEREISASGMFKNRTRGSCSSSSIYLSGCLRALGIPTRTVLFIPVIDASDERELELIRGGIAHHQVRQAILGALEAQKNAWTSHTFNEVWVGGRWRRLNYANLGQNILDPGCLGLMTHVATFADWADARMPETIGRRQSAGTAPRDVFGGPNPYSTIALRDEFGIHARIANPPLAEQTQPVMVTRVFWTDSVELPADIRKGCEDKGRFGLIAALKTQRKAASLNEFLEKADARVLLEAPSHASVGISFDPGCWWLKNDVVYIYLPFGAAEKKALASNVSYRFKPRNESGPGSCQWTTAESLELIRR